MHFSRVLGIQDILYCCKANKNTQSYVVINCFLNVEGRESTTRVPPTRGPKYDDSTTKVISTELDHTSIASTEGPEFNDSTTKVISTVLDDTRVASTQGPEHEDSIVICLEGHITFRNLLLLLFLQPLYSAIYITSLVLHRLS